MFGELKILLRRKKGATPPPQERIKIRRVGGSKYPKATLVHNATRGRSLQNQKRKLIDTNGKHIAMTDKGKPGSVRERGGGLA